MGAASKFKDLFAKKSDSADQGPNKRSTQPDKVRIEQLRKALQDQLRRDPKQAKKAAMIIEEMLKQNSK